MYGKGEQKKPIIALRDVVRSIVNCLNWDMMPGHSIVNQVTECLSVNDIAETVSSNIVHIPNPRVENETHQMEIMNSSFMKYLSSNYTRLETEMDHIEEDMDMSLLPENWSDAYFPPKVDPLKKRKGVGRGKK